MREYMGLGLSRHDIRRALREAGIRPTEAKVTKATAYMRCIAQEYASEALSGIDWASILSEEVNRE